VPINEADSVWEQILPHLNDALERLPKTDRKVVLIRFFARKTHKEVAQALGVTEDIAKKRLSRALEKLRTIFARRGVVVPSVALLAAFTSSGAQAAQAVWSLRLPQPPSRKELSEQPHLHCRERNLETHGLGQAKTAIAVRRGHIARGGRDRRFVVKATGTSTDDLIGKLEHQSGNELSGTNLDLPATLDLKNPSLEEALDRLLCRRAPIGLSITPFTALTRRCAI